MSCIRRARALPLAWSALLVAAAGCYSPPKDTAPPYRVDPDTGNNSGGDGAVDTGIDPDTILTGMRGTVGGAEWLAQTVIARVDSGYLFIEGESEADVVVLIDAVPSGLGVHPLQDSNPFASLTPGPGEDACVAGTGGAAAGEINILQVSTTEVVAVFRFDAGCGSGPVAVEGEIRSAL
jgi:hypothetical protein